MMLRDQGRVFLKKRVLVIRWDRMIVAKKRTPKRIKGHKRGLAGSLTVEAACLDREDQKIADQGKDSHEEGQDDRDTLSSNDFRI